MPDEDENFGGSLVFKFDVLKTSIFAMEASLLGQTLQNIKFPRGNYQPIVPRHAHFIV